MNQLFLFVYVPSYTYCLHSVFLVIIRIRSYSNESRLCRLETYKSSYIGYIVPLV